MLPELKALEILENYEGSNNQILYWKHRVLVDKKSLAKTQAEYVVKYHDKPVRTAKRWMKIDPYWGGKLQETKELPFTPESIWVEKLLAESDKAFHVMGKVQEQDRLEFMWVPKCFVIRVNQKKVSVDYSRYAHRPPLSHQLTAIETLLVNDKFILADDMGVGKTASAVIASIESGASKILIICPATLKINWKREIMNYSKEKIYIVDGKNWESGYKYYIINYDILKNFHEIGSEKLNLTHMGFDLVIIDEAHYISNSSANRSKLVNDACASIPKIWLLTGTPITSRPINYYNLLSLIDCPLAYNWQTYVRRYCKGFQFKVNGKRIWNVNGASNLEELHERTKPFILRRLKSEVLDLPDKLISPVYLELKSKEYEDLMGQYENWAEQEGKNSSLAVQLSKLMDVRMLIAEEKIAYTVELIQSILDQDKKVIVFTNFTATLNAIAAAFPKITVTLDGKMTKPRRQMSVDKFQNDPKIKVFASNLKAGGVGITLTEAEAVVMNDLSFVPSDHAQAEDRAYRYGQKNNVSIYYLLFENTIEMHIYDILNRKKGIINTVMGDEQYSKEVAEELIETISDAGKDIL